MNQVEQVADKMGDHPALEWGARLGYVASGILHLLIAWIAVTMAQGHRGQNADQAGAFATLVTKPLGGVLIVAMVIGLVALGLWQLVEAIRAHEWTDRIKAGGKTLAYGSLAAPAISVLTHTASGNASAESTQSTTRTLLSLPAGFVLILIAAAVVVGVGGYHVYKGATRRFLRDLQKNPGRPAEIVGSVGYIAKGIALMVAGFVLGRAAISGRSSDSRGLDGAFRAIAQAPLGQALLVIMAIGFACYAAYCVVRARHGRV